MIARRALTLTALAVTGCAAHQTRSTSGTAAVRRWEIRGHVVDEHGKPLSGATVLMTDPGQRTWQATSNAHGEYVFVRPASEEPAPPGAAYIDADASGVGAALPRVVALGNTAYDVVLRPTGRISGAVTGALARRPHLLAIAADRSGISAYPDTTGRFLFPTLPEGTYLLDVIVDGRAVRTQPVNVSRGLTVELFLDVPPAPIVPVDFVVHVTGTDCTAVELRPQQTSAVVPPIVKQCVGHEAAFEQVMPGDYEACVGAHCEPLAVAADRGWFELDAKM